MEECVDGEYQTFKSRDGAYVREHFFGSDPVLLERVAHMSDDEIWLLQPRRPRSSRRSTPPTTRRSSTTGQPTVILAKTIKGYGMGVVRRGPDDHPPGQEDDRGRAAARSATASSCRSPTSRCARAEFYKPPDGLARRCSTCASAAPRSAARSRRAGARPSRCAVPEPRAFKAPARGHRRARDLDDDGVRPRARRAAARQADRPAHRADRPRRVAHVRHGGAVPPARHLLAGRPALPARRTPSS